MNLTSLYTVKFRSKSGEILAEYSGNASDHSDALQAILFEDSSLLAVLDAVEVVEFTTSQNEKPTLYHLTVAPMIVTLIPVTQHLVN